VYRRLFGREQHHDLPRPQAVVCHFGNQKSACGSPFFLYFAHMFPHQPLAASAGFAVRSQAGNYADDVKEGQIVADLERAGVADHTLLIFTRDNGHWFEGSAGVLRDGKG
jgi:uncharacterized sulfatase